MSVDWTSHEPSAAGGGEAALGPQPSPDPAAGVAEDAAHRRAHAMMALGRRALTPPDVGVLLHDAAVLLAETLEADFGMVAEVCDDGSLDVQLTGAPTARPIDGWPAWKTGPAGTDSLAGYVLEVAHAVAINDLALERRLTDLPLRQQGTRSAIAVPLKIRGQSFGCLAACSAKPFAFCEQDVVFAETVGHLLTTAIARSRAEKALDGRQRCLARLLETLDAMVVVVGRQWQMKSMNAAAERITGFRLSELERRVVFGALIPPDDAQFLQSLVDQLASGASPAAGETDLLTKHGVRRRILWSGSAWLVEKGEIEEILLTGIDITAQREAETAALRAQRVAEEHRRLIERRWNTESGAARRPGEPGFENSQGSVPSERRGKSRRSYPYSQKIAYIVDDALPPPSLFVDVLCHDIAAGGFSFFADKPPASESLVVALGAAPQVAYLIAQIAHVTRLQHATGTQYLIGCAYTGRANYPAEPRAPR